MPYVLLRGCLAHQGAKVRNFGAEATGGRLARVPRADIGPAEPAAGIRAKSEGCEQALAGGKGEVLCGEGV